MKAPMQAFLQALLAAFIAPLSTLQPTPLLGAVAWLTFMAPLQNALAAWFYAIQLLER